MREIAIVLTAGLIHSLFGWRVKSRRVAFETSLHDLTHPSNSLHMNLIALLPRLATRAKLRGRESLIYPIAARRLYHHRAGKTVSVLPPLLFWRKRSARSQKRSPRPLNFLRRLVSRPKTRMQQQQKYSDNLKEILELKEELATAVRAEEYGKAARLRDRIQNLEDAQSENTLDLQAGLGVMQANAAFYESFKNRDLANMAKLWANETHDESCDGSNWPVCVHPEMRPMRGYDNIVDFWGRFFRDDNMPDMESWDDVKCTLLPGGYSGLITCSHRIAGREFSTSNVFTKGSDGRWRIVMHQAGEIKYTAGASR